MIKDIFSAVADMIVTGAYIILVVLIIRAAMKRLPKRFSYMLWAIPAVRLLCPFTIPSAVSLFNFIKPAHSEKRIAETAEAVSKAMTPAFSASPAEYIPTESAAVYSTTTSHQTAAVSAGFKPDIGEIAAMVWLAVDIGIVIYCAVCYAKMYRILKDSRRDGEYYISSKIESPLVFGFISPKIYLTEGLSEEDSRCILAHERTHIRRCDHIVKLLCIPIAAIHWFNPLVWIGINRMYRDMELSCDEAALNTLGSESKKAYAGALLNMALKQNRISLCGVLCFGEKNIKSRIKGVLSMKKPKIIAIVAAVAVVAVSAVCLLTNALPEKPVDVNEIMNAETVTIPEIKFTRAFSYAGAESNVCLSKKNVDKRLYCLVATKAFVDSEVNDGNIYASGLELMFAPDSSHAEIMLLPGKNFVLKSSELDSYLRVRKMRRPLIIFNSPADNAIYLYTVDNKNRIKSLGDPIYPDDEPLAYQSFVADSFPLNYNEKLYDPDNKVRITFDFWDCTYEIQNDCLETNDVIRRYIETQAMGDIIDCDIQEISTAFEYGGLAYYGEVKRGALEVHGEVYKASYTLKYLDGTEEARGEFFVARYLDDAARIEKVIPCDIRTRTGTIEKRTAADGEEEIYFLDENNGEEIVLDPLIRPMIGYSSGFTNVQGYRLEKIPAGTYVELCYNGDEITPDSIAYVEIIYFSE